MKKLIFSLMVMAAASVSSAQVDFGPSPSDYPQDWALAMVSLACSIKPTGDMYGETQKEGRNRVYTAYNGNGAVVAQAWASNSTIFSKKKCLSK